MSYPALCDYKAGSFVLRLVVFICGIIDQPSNLNLGVRFQWLSSTDYGLATVRQLEDVTLLSPGMIDQLVPLFRD